MRRVLCRDSVWPISGQTNRRTNIRLLRLERRSSRSHHIILMPPRDVRLFLNNRVAAVAALKDYGKFAFYSRLSLRNKITTVNKLKLVNRKYRTGLSERVVPCNIWYIAKLRHSVVLNSDPTWNGRRIRLKTAVIREKSRSDSTYSYYYYYYDHRYCSLLVTGALFRLIAWSATCVCLKCCCDVSKYCVSKWLKKKGYMVIFSKRLVKIRQHYMGQLEQEV